MTPLFLDAELEDADWPKRTDDLLPLDEPQTVSVLTAAVFELSCDVCGEFACRSKSCAPPPVGTGGSEKGVRSAGSVGGTPASVARAGELQKREEDLRDQWGRKARKIGKSTELDENASAVKGHVQKALGKALLEDENGRAAITELLDKVVSDYPVIESDMVPSTGEIFELPNGAVGTVMRLIGWGMHSSDDPAEVITGSKDATVREVLSTIIEWSEARTGTPNVRMLATPDLMNRILDDLGLSGEADLTPERLASEIIVREAVNSWANSSTGWPYSIASQEQAITKHGLSTRVYLDREASVYAKIDPLTKRIADALLDVEYKATQSQLKDLFGDVSTVRLYRGVEGQYPGVTGADVVEVEANPLSSWSFSFDVGLSFAKGDSGIVLEMEVPLEMIQSTPFTGRGCLDELEVILIGRPSTAKRIA